MRGFIFLSLLSLTFAAPQKRFAYSRSPRQPHTEYGPAAPAPLSTTDFLHDLQSAVDAHTGNMDFSSFASNSIEQYPTIINHAQFLTPISSAAETNNLQGPFNEASLKFAQQHQTVQQHATMPIISKRFYLHSAPEEEEDEEQQQHIVVGKPRKNFNVVFIKAPTKPRERTSLKITPAVNEERTIIYVLAKKHDATEIDAQVHEPVTTTTKPEVYFIKYKTNEEAEHAQHSIQSQYDALGGSTQYSNEGIAHVSSAIGSLDSEKYVAGSSSDIYTANDPKFVETSFETQQMDAVSGGEENNGYLPPVRFYK